MCYKVKFFEYNVQGVYDFVETYHIHHMEIKWTVWPNHYFFMV